MEREHCLGLVTLACSAFQWTFGGLGGFVCGHAFVMPKRLKSGI